MMKSWMRLIPMAAVCGCLAGMAWAEDPEAVSERSFVVPQHGSLMLKVPASWREKVNKTPAGLPPTIQLMPAQGDDFAVMITPIWSREGKTDFNAPESVRKLVERNLEQMRPTAVEKEIPIQEIQGVTGKGYYFFVTDRAPRPGEYPYAVSAGMGVGDLLLSVTILTRAKDSSGVTETLKALEQASQKAP